MHIHIRRKRSPIRVWNEEKKSRRQYGNGVILPSVKFYRLFYLFRRCTFLIFFSLHLFLCYICTYISMQYLLFFFFNILFLWRRKQNHFDRFMFGGRLWVHAWNGLASLHRDQGGGHLVKSKSLNCVVKILDDLLLFFYNRQEIFGMSE